MSVGALALGAGALIDGFGGLLAGEPTVFLAILMLKAPFYGSGMTLLGGGAVVRRLVKRKEERDARY